MEPRNYFVGLGNLPVLAREYNRHGVGGEELQQTLLAKALVRCGFEVSMVVDDYGQPDGAAWEGCGHSKRIVSMPVFRFIHRRWTGVWDAVKRSSADIYYCSCASILPVLLASYARGQSPRPRLILCIAHDRDCAPNALLIRFWRDRKNP